MAIFNSIQRNLISASEPSNKINTEIMNRQQKILKASLLHLEFINKFELYLDNKNSNHFSIDFLLELTRLKQEVQAKTIQTSEMLNREYAKAI